MGDNTARHPSPAAAITSGQVNHQLRFPFQLHSMLRDADERGFEQVVAWRQDGKAFKVFDRKMFEDLVLPIYFDMTKVRMNHNRFY